MMPSNPNSYTVSLFDSILMLNSSPKLFKHFKINNYQGIIQMLYKGCCEEYSTDGFELDGSCQVPPASPYNIIQNRYMIYHII